MSLLLVGMAVWVVVVVSFLAGYGLAASSDFRRARRRGVDLTGVFSGRDPERLAAELERERRGGLERERRGRHVAGPFSGGRR